MTGPVKLAVKPVRQELQEDIVARLERALARAKEGAFTSLALFAELADSEEIAWERSGTLSLTQTIGQLEVLKQDLVRTAMEED